MNGLAAFNLGLATFNLIMYFQTGNLASLGCAGFSSLVALYCYDRRKK